MNIIKQEKNNILLQFRAKETPFLKKKLVCDIPWNWHLDFGFQKILGAYTLWFSDTVAIYQ